MSDRWQFDDIDTGQSGHHHAPAVAADAGFEGWSGPRYTRLPLPACRFLPGRDGPRPDAAHITGLEAHAADPADWQRCMPYQYGVDCFNRGYWWEAAACWQPLAASADLLPDCRAHLTGLTRAAEALLRRRMGWRSAVASLRLECRRAFAPVRQTTVMGLDLAAWWPALDRCLRPGGVDFPRIELVGMAR